MNDKVNDKVNDQVNDKVNDQVEIVVDGEKTVAKMLFVSPNARNILVGGKFKLQNGPSGVAVIDVDALQKLGLKKQPSKQPSEQPSEQPSNQK